MRFLDNWQSVVHQRNVEKGFYDYKKDLIVLQAFLSDPARTLMLSDERDALQRVLVDYSRAQVERKLLLVIGELCEAHEELRSGHEPKHVYYHPDKPLKPEGFGVEMADAGIRLLDVMESLGLDLNDLMELKHAYNGTREHKHGRCF